MITKYTKKLNERALAFVKEDDIGAVLRNVTMIGDISRVFTDGVGKKNMI